MSAAPNMRGAAHLRPVVDNVDEAENKADGLWHEAQHSPETETAAPTAMAKTIRRLITALAEPFRETFVLREINDLSLSRNCRCRRACLSAP